MLARIRKSVDEKDQGFTLIELLVVMIIIGILAAIAIPVFLNQRKKAVDSAMKSDLRTVANEMETSFTDNQTYPAAITQTGTSLAITGGNTVTLSKNDTMSLTLNSATPVTAYCLAADPGSAGSHAWVYISSKGGLQASSVVVCPAAGTF